MVVYSVFIISRSGGLIFHYDRPMPKAVDIDKSVSTPPRFIIKEGRIEMELGTPPGYFLTSVNGEAMDGDQQIKGVPALEYLSNIAHYPLTLKLTRRSLSVNERIYLASTFFSVSAIAGQLSPCAGHSGIRSLHTDGFTLHCHQAPTGIKFLAITDPRQSQYSVDSLLRKMYELYADFALKNPFYTLEMPIRCSLFDSNLESTLDATERTIENASG